MKRDTRTFDFDRIYYNLIKTLVLLVVQRDHCFRFSLDDIKPVLAVYYIITVLHQDLLIILYRFKVCLCNACMLTI